MKTFPQQTLSQNVHNSLIPKSPKLETTQYPPTGEKMSKRRSVHTVDYYSAIKMQGLIHTTQRWISKTSPWVKETRNKWARSYDSIIWNSRLDKTTFEWQKADCGCLRWGWGEGWTAERRGISRRMKILYAFMGRGYMGVSIRQNSSICTLKMGALSCR